MSVIGWYQCQIVCQVAEVFSLLQRRVGGPNVEGSVCVAWIKIPETEKVRRMRRHGGHPGASQVCGPVRGGSSSPRHLGSP